MGYLEVNVFVRESMCFLFAKKVHVSLPSHIQIITQCKLELKRLEPEYRDVRVVIPHLEYGLTVEYDQFSTVADVLNQVLSMSSPPLSAAQGYSLYHVRLRAK